MKFGDKLIELRKKNGYSQEDLAEKLGVSRQSVSKWESNNTYPETDKIIQIANLFDVSMDDLINDKVTDVESSLRKNKNNIQNIWDSLLEFITDTVNMFSKMKFSEGLKCIIEIIIIGILLSILGNILCGSASRIIANIFSFLSTERITLIRNTLNAIFKLIWFVIALIIIIHTFKIRYLNKYEKEKKEESKNMESNKKEIKEAEVIEEKKKENKKEEVKEEKITSKEKDEKPAEFLGVLSKIVIIFAKIIIFFILIGVSSIALGLTIASVILFTLVYANIVFLWLALMLLAGTIIAIQISILLIKFIFNRKIHIVAHIITFISCIVLAGVSIGLLTMSIKDINFIHDNSGLNIETKEIELTYKDNLVLRTSEVGSNSKYKYIIDNNIEENKIIVSRNIDNKYFEMKTNETTNDTMPVIYVLERPKSELKLFYDFYVNNLKKNKVYTLKDYYEDKLVIKANESTINKLLDNLNKLYLTEEKRTDNEIDIITHKSKVYFKNGLRGKYNAINDTIEYSTEDYSCRKEIESTSYGERIIYTCEYKDED